MDEDAKIISAEIVNLATCLSLASNKMEIYKYGAIN